MVQKRRTLRKPTWEKIKGSENQLTDTAMKSKCFGEIKVGKRQPKKRKQKPWRRKRRMRRRIRRVEWERKTEWLTFERARDCWRGEKTLHKWYEWMVCLTMRRVWGMRVKHEMMSFEHNLVTQSSYTATCITFL